MVAGVQHIELIVVIILVGVIASIGFPRLRDGLEKQNVRSAKALIATWFATARGAAIQRGCSATLNSRWRQRVGDGVRREPAGSVGPGGTRGVGKEFQTSR